MSDFKWRHFRGEMILGCVRWYCKYGISYRDLEEMMLERGLDVDHTTLYRWVQHYAPENGKAPEVVLETFHGLQLAGG
jgi:IS6 family transposase